MRLWYVRHVITILIQWFIDFIHGVVSLIDAMPYDKCVSRPNEHFKMLLQILYGSKLCACVVQNFLSQGELAHFCI